MSSLKRHPALYRAIRAIHEKRVGCKPTGATLKRLRRSLAVLFTDRPFLEGVVAASGGDLPRPAVEETVRHALLQLAEPLEKQLRAITCSARPGSVTLAGDEAQQTSSSFAGWPAALSTLGAGDAATCRLAVSYRCPEPVVELARRLLGALAPQEPLSAARDGAPIGVFHFPDEAQAHLFLVGALRDLVEREPLTSVAIIARDADAARAFHGLVAEPCDARLVLHGEFSFEPGVDVIDVDTAKGIEFDYVIVPDASAATYPLNDEARRRLHVAITRTSHQLWLVSSGTPPPLLAKYEPTAARFEGAGAVSG